MHKKYWMIVLVLFLASVNNYMDRQALSVLAPVLKDELNLSNIDYSLILNAFLVAYAIMYAASGYLTDLLGGRRGVALCILVWSIAATLHATTIGFLSLILYRFLLGLAEPGLYPGAVKVITQFFSARARALAIGIVVSGTSIGAILAPPLVVWLLLHFGWRTAFLCTGLSGFLILIAWHLVYRPEDEKNNMPALDNKQHPTATENYRWTGLFRLPAVWALMGIRGLTDATWFFLLFWLSDYLVTERGFSMSLLGKTGWIPYIGVDLGIILGAIASGAIIRHGGKVLTARKIIAVPASILIPFGIITSLYVEDPYIIVSLLAIAVFGMGLWISTIHALPSDLFPFDNVASVYGLAGTAGALSSIGFMSLAGILVESGQYTLAFWLASFLCPLAILILLLFIRPVTPL